MYHWGFDLSSFRDGAEWEGFLDRNKLELMYRDMSEHFHFLSPHVYMIIETIEPRRDELYIGSVGISCTSQAPLLKVVNDFRRSAYFIKGESPRDREFI